MFSFTFAQRLICLGAGVVSLIGMSSFIGTSPSYAVVLTNGGFENGNFNNWDALGVTSIETATFGSGPTEGTFQALLSTDASSSASDFELASFLGLPSGSLDSMGAVGGSAIKTSFTAAAGDILSFKWNLLTDELKVPTNTRNDFAFVTISNLSKLADTNSTFVASATPLANETGFQTFSYMPTTTGTYTLGIGVADGADFDTRSALLVDNVELTSQAVPEPEMHPTWGLLILGAFAARKVFIKKSQQ